jgi:hypothetical protein
MGRHHHFLVIFIFYSWSIPGMAKFLYHNECVLRDDPKTKEPSIVTTCVNGQAGMWVAQKSKTPPQGQPPSMYRAQGNISLFVTPWLSYTGRAHSSVFISRETKQTTSRETSQDLSLIQIGNNALSRHRVSFGRGSPVYRINHQMRENMGYIWNLGNFDAPLVNFATYTYDNQLDLTVQVTYGINPDQKLSIGRRVLGAGRVMYDLAALEGTRIVIGAFGDGKLRRAASFGMLNANGAGAETALEIVRSFAANPYDPYEFHQNIRLSYLSPREGNSRYTLQYDDEFKFIRLVGLGAVYYVSKNAETEVVLGYAKQEDVQKLSHFYAILRAGVRI